MSAAEFWSKCLTVFAEDLSAHQFNTWIKPLHAEDAESGVHIVVPNKFAMQWVQEKYLSQLHAIAFEFFGSATPIHLVLGVAHRVPPTHLPVPTRTKHTHVKKSVQLTVDDSSRLNPLFTFDNFVTGKANQLARAAAIQVADNPGVAYNPLFVYGGVGLGKTHLVQAIGNNIKSHNPDLKIRYVHAEKYVADVVKAYQHKAFEEFKRYYHSLDILLIDDIQFFANKSRTQEEFFFAFNALVDAHKQVIMTCDTFPREMSDVDERLKSRFGWGLTVAIEPPELEMRVAILLRKSAQEQVELDDASAFFIAKHVRSNVRELEGALKRVIAYARFANHAINLELCKEALRDLLAIQNRMVSVENIQKTVADFFKIKVQDMYSSRRTRNIARPRQLAMALAKDLTSLSLPDIGEAFGGRDHTTVLHACRKIQELRGAEPEIAHAYNVLLQILKN